jgi:hypothetical protein
MEFRLVVCVAVGSTGGANSRVRDFVVLLGSCSDCVLHDLVSRKNHVGSVQGVCAGSVDGQRLHLGKAVSLQA